VTQEIENLPRKYQALSLSPSPSKNKNKKKNKTTTKNQVASQGREYSLCD
jgi:hypothetical protein